MLIRMRFAYATPLGDLPARTFAAVILCRARLSQPVFRMGVEIACDALRSRNGVLEKRHRVTQAVVGLGATEAEKALAGGTEALAAEAGHAPLVVSAFEQ